MISRYKTQVVFWSACVLSIASIALLMRGRTPASASLVAVSVALNIFSIVVGEGKGFVRSPEMRRAYEPLRRFNAIHVMVLLVLIVAQVGSVAYVLLSVN